MTHLNMRRLFLGVWAVALTAAARSQLPDSDFGTVVALGILATAAYPLAAISSLTSQTNWELRYIAACATVMLGTVAIKFDLPVWAQAVVVSAVLGTAGAVLLFQRVRRRSAHLPR